MQERGWNQEFRTMGYQVLIQKKISRDLGTDADTRGQQHMRRNLLQIIQVEVLLENAGWDTDPGARREDFVSLEGETLSEDLTKFWTLCTDNRNKGIVSLSAHILFEVRDADIKENPVKSGFLQITFTPPPSPPKFLERISLAHPDFKIYPP